MNDNVKRSSAESRVKRVKQETCKKGYIVKVGKFEMLFEKQGNIVKLISIKEDLEELKIQIDPVKKKLYKIEVKKNSKHWERALCS